MELREERRAGDTEVTELGKRNVEPGLSAGLFHGPAPPQPWSLVNAGNGTEVCAPSVPPSLPVRPLGQRVLILSF
jgi:hypothetical protein